MKSVRIRFAIQSDLDGIYLVEDRSFSEPYPHELITELLRNNPGSFLVAESTPGIIFGYCVAVEEGDSAHLISIGVLDEWRRRGVGTSLLQKLLENLSSRVEELRLEVKQGNFEAINMYERLGFRRVGLFEDYYADGSSAVKMLLGRYRKQRHGSRRGIN